MKTFKAFTDCHIKHADLSNVGLFWKPLLPFLEEPTQQTFSCSKPTIEVLEKGVKHIQS